MNNQLINDLINGDFLGWNGVDPERQKADMLAVAGWYRETFSTESGRRVLAIMLQSTLMQSTVTGQSTQFEAGIREGRADIVRGIFRQIELANTGGKETLQPWQTLTPPKAEPAPQPQKPKARRASST